MGRWDLSLCDISKHRYRELFQFCQQYQEMKTELSEIEDALKSPDLSGMPRPPGISDTTGNLATRRAELSHRCQIIEQAAIEADPERYQEIIDNITQSETSSKDKEFITARRVFFYILDRKRG